MTSKYAAAPQSFIVHFKLVLIWRAYPLVRRRVNQLPWSRPLAQISSGEWSTDGLLLSARNHSDLIWTWMRAEGTCSQKQEIKHSSEQLRRSCHRIKMLSALVSAFYLGDRRVWSMWHCLSFLFWSRTQTSDRALRRCWVGWWVAASETWSENTCVRSDCWMIRSIPAPFRSVSVSAAAAAPVLPKNSDQQTFCCRLGEACAVGFNSRCQQHPP